MATEPNTKCPTCRGKGVVDDGAIYGSGGVEFENGPVFCVKDCPACAGRAALASAPAIEPVSPMAKMAQALRDKAAAEKASFDTRVQSGEWGPAPDAGTEADCQLEHVAQVEGDAVVRTLRWNKNVGAFEYPVGTKLYAASAPLASAPAAEPVYIQSDHLQKARRSPHLCRVEPTQRLPDFVPLYAAPQPAQPAPQVGAATYTAADVTDAHAKGYALGLAQRDRPPTFTPQAGAAEALAKVKADMASGCCNKTVSVRCFGCPHAAHPTEQPSQDAATLECIRAAINTYHLALDRCELGVVAADRALYAYVRALEARRALPSPAAGEPELPEPDLGTIRVGREDVSLGWSPEAIRAYGQAMAEHARRAAMEEAVQAAADVDEPAWHGYECPNTFQDGVSAAIAAIRAAAPPQGEPK